MHEVQSAACGAAVGDEDLLCVVEKILLPAGDLGGLGLDFVHEMVEELIDSFRLLRGESPDIMIQSGHIVTV
jgi:hypothetical protein